MMPSISFEQIRVFLVGALIIAVLIAIAIGASFLTSEDGDGVPDNGDNQGPGFPSPLTNEEKKQILESSGGGGVLTDEEKKAILESSSPPSGADELTDEEKIRILENLTPPK